MPRDRRDPLISQDFLPSISSILHIFLNSTYEQICAAAHICSYAPAGPMRDLTSGTILAKERQIRFQALQTSGLPFPANDYDVRWRVVNTDTEAAQRNQLRGGFYPSDTHGVRWESTLYRGAHWVEAFVARRRTRTVIGKSDRFFVVIE